jgi:hypothetical protein
VCGAAIAVAVGEVGAAVAAGIAFHRALPDARVALDALWRVGIAAAAAAGAAVALGLPAAVQVVVGTVVFFGVLVALRGVPAELIEELRRLRDQRDRSTSR